MNTRDQLKKIAMDVVQDRGVRALTLRDLGEAAGIKSSSVAYHFGSKDALLREITGDYIARVMEAARLAEQNHPAGLEPILSLFEQFEGLGKADRMCLGGVMAGSFHEVDEETADLVRKFFRDLEKWFAGQIASASGATIDRANAHQRARMLVAAAQGALLLDKTDGGSTHMRAVKKSVQVLLGP